MTSRCCWLTGALTCRAGGDPHYHTFDARTIHYMGTCVYTLVQPCTPVPGTPDFTVEAKNEHRHGNTRVSWTSDVRVRVYGVTVTLGQGGAVQVRRDA